jgi:hypothetical protein
VGPPISDRFADAAGGRLNGSEEPFSLNCSPFNAEASTLWVSSGESVVDSRLASSGEGEFVVGGVSFSSVSTSSEPSSIEPMEVVDAFRLRKLLICFSARRRISFSEGKKSFSNSVKMSSHSIDTS